MKAAVSKTYGPPEVLKIEDVPQPTIQEDDDGIVLIKVHSSSVNAYDYLHRKGYLLTRISNGYLKPKHHILGIDAAGTIGAVSKNVDRLKVGDRVFGNCLGSHAEYVRARQKNISLMPKNASFQEVAAIPTAALTALQALRDVAQIRSGQKVLIYGASGGIGHFAVQLARYYGTEVTAVCSTSNLPWVKALGADHMVDYTQEDFARNGKKYDIILDTVGKRTFFNSRGSLTQTGVYITEHILYPKYHVFQFLFGSLLGDKRAKTHLSRANFKDMDFLRELVEDEKIKPVIEKRYPLDRIVEAHRHVENGHTKGKVVIEIHRNI